MAEKEPTASKKRRIVKNPETFREKVVKAAETADKPRRRSKVGGAIASVFRIVGKPFRWVGSKLGKYKVFRFIGRILWPVYFRESWKELKLVTWPNWKKSRDLTFAVLVFAVIFGATVAVVDFGLDKLFRHVLLK